MLGVVHVIGITARLCVIGCRVEVLQIVIVVRAREGGDVRTWRVERCVRSRKGG